ncbi:MAG: DNA primase [Candidatus Levybacteria bacterium]|nr:DNA primase [Candidatus Levybacteria bacterium]
MDQASRVREKIDIVGFISEYLPLKKMGRNFTTICPFHSENTPSFVVSPERQIWHCFGCGKGGDAFTFLMEYENLEFIEALRILGKKAGIEIKTYGTPFSSSKKELIYSLNKLAAEYYNFVLTKHSAGKEALEYLVKHRKLTDKLIKTFNIGFAPFRGEDLSNYLINKKKFSKNDLIEAGLSFQRENRVIDFFRGRIIFPLIDHRGNVAGFSGRTLTEKDFGPKYINTKDTLVYHKGGMFFGLNLAKDEIKKQGSTIVMEGEFDVISAYKEGITNVVALKGTALTEPQALLLSRFAPKTALCLDQDSAGILAMKRSIPFLEKRGLMVSVIVPSGKDPDEAIKKNPSAFKKAIKNDIEIYDFFISKLTSENDINSASGKKAVTDELLPLISMIQNEIVKEHYLKKLSREVNTSYESLLRQLDRKTEGKNEKVFQKLKKLDRREMLEEYLLALIIQSKNPKDEYLKSKEILINYEFLVPSIGKILSEFLILSKKFKQFDIKNLSKNLAKELLPVFDKCFLMLLPKFENAEKVSEEAIKVSKELRVFFLKNRIREISETFKNTKKNDWEIKKLREEISAIVSQIASA